MNSTHGKKQNPKIFLLITFVMFMKGRGRNFHLLVYEGQK